MQYDGIETAVKLALKKFGKIDILINGKLHLLRLILCGNYAPINVMPHYPPYGHNRGYVGI